MAISAPEELTIGLFERGAIGFATVEQVGVPNGFIRLKSGRLSPTYVNLRGLSSLSKKSSMTPRDQVELRDLVLSSYSEVIDEGESYDHLLGIPHAMTALGAMVGLRRGDSVLSMRTENKEHGIPKLIEGDYQPGESVMAVDDVVTDGASKFETVEKISAAGLVISRFAILVDREEGGRQTMEAADLDIASAIGMGAITAILAEQRLINDRQVHWTARYFQGLIDEGVIAEMPYELARIV